MKCSLHNKLRKDHDNVRDVRYVEQFMKCPLFNSKQICLWCCLHISDLANPVKRTIASEKNESYYLNIPGIMERDWDSAYVACSRCLGK